MIRNSLIILTLVVVAGCGKSDKPKLVKVTGTVMYKNQPVSGADVTFYNEKSPRAAMGRTDANGKFTLSTINSNDGAVPGEHVITISKPKPTTLGADTSMSAENPNAAYGAAMAAAAEGRTEALATQEVPTKYASRDRTDLKRTVVEDGTNDFLLELTD